MCFYLINVNAKSLGVGGEVGIDDVNATTEIVLSRAESDSSMTRATITGSRYILCPVNESRCPLDVQLCRYIIQYALYDSSIVFCLFSSYVMRN